MEEGMAVEMVRSIEPLAANLTEELLVVGVGVDEEVALKVVLLREPLATDLTRDRHLLGITALCTHHQVPNDLQRLWLQRLSLNEGQALLVDWISSEDAVHERAFGDGVCKLQHVLVFASVDGSFKLQERFRF